MKRTVKALLAMALIAAMLFALVACGGSKSDIVGTWKLSSMEEDGDAVDLDSLEELGLTCTLKVKSDGTAKISAEDVDFKATLKDDTLTLKDGDDKISFTKSKKDLSDTVKKDRDMAKANEEAEEEEADGKGTRKAITPAVTVADDDLCTITVTEKFEDRWGIIGLKVEITNKTDKDLTFHSVSGKTSVNNTMKTGWFSCRMMGGTNATEKFTFSTGDLNSIDELVNINFTIGVYEDDTYEDIASYSATIP